MNVFEYPVEGGSVSPTRSQALLLQVLLADDAIARDAWRQWIGQVDVMELDDGSNRLLPMLYNRLRHLQIEHPLRNRIKGIYRHAAYRNRLLFHRASQLIQMLSEHDIEVLLLKGIILAQQHYEDCAERPMGDVDILVRREDAERAAELFSQSADWHAAEPFPLEDLDALRHAQGYKTTHGFSVDLHWNLFPEICYYPQAMQGFWDRSQTSLFQGQPVRVLSPEDQLFHLCAHGLRWNSGSCLRWSVDAMQFIRRQGGLDWDALLDRVEGFRYQVLFREAMRFLARELDAPVPSAVLTRLEQAEVPVYAEKQYALTSSRRGLLGVLPPFWMTYRLHTHGRRGTGQPAFSRCLLSTLNIDRYRQLPGIVWHNGWSRLSDWADPRTGFGRSVSSNSTLAPQQDAREAS